MSWGRAFTIVAVPDIARTSFQGFHRLLSSSRWPVQEYSINGSVKTFMQGDGTSGVEPNVRYGSMAFEIDSPDGWTGVWSRGVLGLVWRGESARRTFDTWGADFILDGQLGVGSADRTDRLPIDWAKRSVIGDVIGKYDATAVPNNALRKLRDCGRSDAEYHGSDRGCYIWDLHDLGRDEFDTGLGPLKRSHVTWRRRRIHSCAPLRRGS